MIECEKWEDSSNCQQVNNKIRPLDIVVSFITTLLYKMVKSFFCFFVRVNFTCGIELGSKSSSSTVCLWLTHFTLLSPFPIYVSFLGWLYVCQVMCVACSVVQQLFQIWFDCLLEVCVLSLSMSEEDYASRLLSLLSFVVLR